MRKLLLAWIVAAVLLSVSAGSPQAEAAVPPFGDGSDGALIVTVNTQFNPPVDALVVAGTVGNTTFSVSAPSGTFLPGQRVLIHQTQGSGAGSWELNTVQSYALGNVTTADPLANTYSSPGAQVLVVPEYSSATVNAGATLSAKPWDGGRGGILAILVSGTASIQGTMSADGSDGINSSGAGQTAGAVGGGFRGGAAYRADSPNQAFQGEGIAGGGLQMKPANTNGGGGGGQANNLGAGGGGGGHGTAGSTGLADGGDVGGTGGSTAGSADLSVMVFGGGGGGGQQDDAPASAGTGGSGGGVVFLAASTVTVSGSLSSNGGDGGAVSSEFANGGAGAGGSILIRGGTMTLGSSQINASGGIGGNNSGHGGVGRIRAEYCSSISGGIVNPAASVAQISCSADSDGDGFDDVAPSLHQGPSNTNTALDNCPGLSNPDQLNSDGNFIDLSPDKAFNDTTWPNSDASGDACDSEDDNDGRSDADEIAGAGGCAATNPLVRDTDGDRFLDGAECSVGTDPNSTASRPGGGGANPPLSACGDTSDTDADGIIAQREVCFYNTNPLVANTDGDICPDGKEVASVNADNIVSAIDLSQVASAFGAYPFGAPAYRYDFDVTKDGTIGAIDLSQVAARFGACP